MATTMNAQNNAIERENLDTSVKPGENFYLYANGGWLENNPIPGDKSRFGSFDMLADSARKQVRVLIKKTAQQEHEHGTIAQKIGDFYASGMDMEARNKAGIKPLNRELQMIENANNNQDIMAVVAQLHRDGLFPLFSLFGTADAKNSEMVRTHLFQGGLGLPNRDYYTDTDERTENIKKEYVRHIAKMFVLSGESEDDATLIADKILTLETRLAKASMTPLEIRDPHKRYNKMDLEELQSLSPEINWEDYFKTLGLGDPEIIIVGQPAFFKEVNAMMSEVPTEEWKNYLKWDILNSTSSYLSEDIVEQDFAFYGKILTGKEENQPLWKRVQGATNGAMS